MADERILPVENAPSVFQVSDHNISDCYDDSVAIERCPICRNGCHNLICSNCVLNETIDLKRRFSSFSDGLRKLYDLSKNRNEIDRRITEKTYKLYKRADKEHEVGNQKRKLENLKGLLEKKSKEIETKKKSIEKTRDENSRSRKRISTIKHRLPYMDNRIESLNQLIVRKTSEQEQWDERLRKRKRRIILEIENDIFHIEEVTTSRYSSDEKDVDPISAELADASSHQFVRGQWAYIQSAGEPNYQIIGFQLSSVGEYPSLLQYVSRQKDGSNSKAQKNVDLAKEEWIGLGYTSHLVSSVARVLDVVIPYKTHMSNMELNEMSVKDLYNFLAQLNYNITYLSCSQGVCDLSAYDPARSIHNLYNLIKNESIGRSGAFELVCTSLLQSMESRITSPYTDDEAESDIADNDWETVTGPPSDDPSGSTQPISYTSATSELVTSAISSVVSSFWPFR